MLAQKEYKRRHDNVARAIHWICQENVGSSEMRGGMTMFQKLCLEMTITNFCGTFTVRTDHEIGARRPDLMVIDKRDRSCQIIDVEIP